MRSFLLAALSLLLCGLPATAQGTPALGAGNEVGMRVWLRPGASPVAGGTLPMLGIGGTLRLSSAIEVGGEGILGLGRVQVVSSTSPERAEVTLGYGGLQFRYMPGAEVAGRWGAEVLLGAGTARMYSALVDAELESENFFVIKPALGFRQPISNRLSASLWAAYRLTPGADPLPGISGDEFEGPVVSLEISFVRDP